MKIESICRRVLSIVLSRRAVLIVSSLLVASCGLIPRIPIQISRVVQTEEYEQIFVLVRQSDTDSAEAVVRTSECDSEATEYLDDVFLRLLGPRNWRNLSAAYGMQDICNELLSGSISLKGFMSFVVYLLPSNHDQFQIEGSGHYFLVRKSDDEKILMSGDFQFKPVVHSIEELRRGYLELYPRLITTKVLAEDTFLHESDVRYRIYIDTARSDQDVYAIDYKSRHQAYLGEDLFGEIVIADDGNETKLLDLRGTSFLQTDY